MDSNDASKISNKEIILQMINFNMRHRRIMQNYLEKTGVYQAQHRLLMEISDNKDASQKDIADSMDVSAATIATSLKKLEKGGYIIRERHEEDNRLNIIAITEKGKKVVEQSKQIFEMADRKVFEGFNDEEKHTLSKLLQKLNANLVIMEAELHKERNIKL